MPCSFLVLRGRKKLMPVSRQMKDRSSRQHVFSDKRKHGHRAKEQAGDEGIMCVTRDHCEGYALVSSILKLDWSPAMLPSNSRKIKRSSPSEGIHFWSSWHLLAVSWTTPPRILSKDFAIFKGNHGRNSFIAKFLAFWVRRRFEIKGGWIYHPILWLCSWVFHPARIGQFRGIWCF